MTECLETVSEVRWTKATTEITRQCSSCFELYARRRNDRLIITKAFDVLAEGPVSKKSRGDGI